MTSQRKKVFVAISGGVDSSTAAALLLQQGCECSGVFMITCDLHETARENAQKVAERLDIPFHVLDLRGDFERILDYFCSGYQNGRTPNPCVMCNRYIKFRKLWSFAKDNGAELLATGHYARILKDNNDIGLYSAADDAKDQSYALAMIDRSILPYLIFPMGEYSKGQTRQLAEKMRLGTAKNTESQDICFIPDKDYVTLLEHRCPQLTRKGNIIDSGGKVLGEHNGIHKFTIGQRRGLKVAMGKPYYVTNIDPRTNTVTLGPKEQLIHKKLFATNPNWLTPEPASEFRAIVKIRYNSSGTPATVRPQKDGLLVEFDEPVSAITPGQLACFYRRQAEKYRVLGGAWIDKAFD